MTLTPFRLAALASAALPDFAPSKVTMLPHSTDTLEALVSDDAGKQVTINVALNALEALRGDAERSVLLILTDKAAADLPFALPEVLGQASTSDVGSLRLSSSDDSADTHFDGEGQAFIFSALPGSPLSLEQLRPGPGLTASLGRALAAIHELNPDIVRDAGLPDYDADSYRQRRLAEVDQAAATGKVPARLLNRWEKQLENVALWRFQPTVCHGELSEDRVRAEGDRIVAVTGWAQLRVADPADDLAWLIASCDGTVIDSIMEAYSQARGEAPGPMLRRRAELLSELALVGWLLYGLSQNDQNVIDDATDMLAELDDQLHREEEAEREASEAAASEADSPEDPEQNPGDGRQGY
ncbi:phosphotransferase [Saxibacter everestensis]|uniref:Phosphotransferase n=1 Tax=Saxibacter everestensis TaxID=2909229 RepID=A0ABY8QNI6_9MICO|nr:phosphotransferase [Brevibacteriaceae bacterium ZFBP1038]